MCSVKSNSGIHSVQCSFMSFDQCLIINQYLCTSFFHIMYLLSLFFALEVRNQWWILPSSQEKDLFPTTHRCIMEFRGGLGTETTPAG